MHDHFQRFPTFTIKQNWFWSEGSHFFHPLKTNTNLEINLSLPLIKMRTTDFTCPEYKSCIMKKSLNTQLNKAKALNCEFGGRYIMYSDPSM